MGAEGVGNKTFGGGVGPVQVTARQPGTAGIQLARNSGGHGRHSVAHYVNLAVGQRPPHWNLPVGAQPYQPSRTDANAPGDLPILEAPTIGGNTYAFTVNTIQPQIRANLAVFAPAGKVATERKAITVVSHPGTIVPAERAAIEALLGAFDGLRYDKDTGPVRFVTAAQLAKAYRP